VELARTATNPERAQSLEFRIDNEDMLVRKALERPWLGWGRWGRSRVYDEEGRDLSVTDGLWIIVLGTGGVLALVAMTLFLSAPTVILLRRVPVACLSDPRLAGPLALTTALLLWQVDEILNGMIVPVYPMIVGAMVSFGRSVAIASRAAPVRRREVTAAWDPPPPGAVGHDELRSSRGGR
jgi:hypothetical protein